MSLESDDVEMLQDALARHRKQGSDGGWGHFYGDDAQAQARVHRAALQVGAGEFRARHLEVPGIATKEVGKILAVLAETSDNIHRVRHANSAWWWRVDP
jgi:hypothetical protein